MADILIAFGNHRAASTVARDVSRYKGQATAEDCYGFARLYARCATLAGAEIQSTQMEGEIGPYLKGYRDQAWYWLAEAISAKGFKDVTRIEQDHAFQSVREFPRIKMLLTHLKAPQPPPLAIPTGVAKTARSRTANQRGDQGSNRGVKVPPAQWKPAFGQQAGGQPRFRVGAFPARVLGESQPNAAGRQPDGGPVTAAAPGPQAELQERRDADVRNAQRLADDAYSEEALVIARRVLTAQRALVPESDPELAAALMWFASIAKRFRSSRRPALLSRRLSRSRPRPAALTTGARSTQSTPWSGPNAWWDSMSSVA